MRIILLFAAAGVVTDSSINGEGNELAGFFQCRQKIVAKSGNYKLKFKEATFRIQSERVLRTQTEQIFKDIESNARPRRQVLKNFTIANSTWKNGIFYAFNTSDHHVQKVFKMGVKVWSENTCIDFVENRNAQDKVVVVKEDECWSSCGQVGGDQFLSLDDCATEGSAVHEIGHVLGLLHTMSRHDRDDYIKVIRKNVEPAFIANFAKVSHTEADVYGLTYDYGSIMHYDELSCSANNRTTVIAKNRYYQKTMGSEIISFSDIFVVNEHHGCNAKCNKSTSAKCANEGYPHPRNCSICICPGGYGGALCDRRPPGCGEDLVATTKKQSLTQTLGNVSGLRDHFDFCNYMISAPEGKLIEVEIRSISSGYDFPGCPIGGVEVKAQKDQKLTGYRFCSVLGSTGLILSNSSRLALILFNKYSSMQTTFTYRHID